LGRGGAGRSNRGRAERGRRFGSRAGREGRRLRFGCGLEGRGDHAPRRAERRRAVPRLEPELLRRGSLRGFVRQRFRRHGLRADRAAAMVGGHASPHRRERGKHRDGWAGGVHGRAFHGAVRGAAHAVGAVGPAILVLARARMAGRAVQSGGTTDMSADPAGEGAWALAIHGGAGAGSQEAGAEEREAQIRAALAEVLDAGARRLAGGASALDAVEDAVKRLEDSPLFNAGKGSVFNERGEHELDASIMDGASLRAGAVAGLRTVKNPIVLARLVLEHSPHVFLIGEGALAVAERHRVELVDQAYFGTERRRAAFEAAKKRETLQTSSLRPGDTGTVGAVALDTSGNLAAATSTGGLTNKAVGRVGDSAVIGAGTFASN